MNINKNINIYFTFIVILFLITAGIRPSVQVASIVLFLFVFVNFCYIKIFHIKSLHSLTKDEVMLFLAFLFMCLSALPPLLVNNSLSIGYRELDIVSKYLLFSLIILLIFKIKPKINTNILLYFIAFAGILNGVISLMQIYIFPDMLFHGRLQGYSGINEYGLMCGSFCILNLIIFMYDKRNPLFIIASFLSLVGVMGSGLRGVMLAILFSYFIVCLLNIILKRISIKHLIFPIILFLVGFFIIGYIVLNSMSSDRVEYTSEEISSIKSGHYDTSIGMRLVMYKEALAIFSLSPFIGMSAKTQLDNASKISAISGFDKAINEAKDGKPLYGKKHNEILTFMAQRGIIGLICILFFYFAVINIFIKNKDILISSLGLSLLFLYIGVGFSGDPLNGHPESTFFLLLLVSLLSANTFNTDKI